MQNHPDDATLPTITPFVIVQISHCCGNVVRFSLVKSPLAEGHCGIIPGLVPGPPAPSGVRGLNPADGVDQFTGTPRPERGERFRPGRHLVLAHEP